MTSPLNAALELGRRLTEAGHEVTFLSHADVGADVGARGFGFVRLTGGNADRKAVVARAGRGPVARIAALRRARAETIANDEIERSVASLSPDALLIDIEMHYAVIATARLGIPTMLAMSFFSVFRRAGLPPLNTRLVPGPTPRSRREIKLAWTRVRVEALGARIRHKLGKGGVGDVLRPVSYDTLHYADLRQVARERGYDLSENTDRNQWLRPYVYTRLPILCFSGVEMELPHTPHPSIRYVGPMVAEHRPERRFSPEDQRQWENFERRRREVGADRPLIYCSLGSYWSDPAFYRMVLQTFSRRPDWDLVLGLGGQVTREELQPLPQNVTVLSWAPQLEILQIADCAITHGGFGSLNECILNEVPMVVYSPSLTDQDGNAARVAYHGLGVRADWRTDEPQALERYVGTLLEDGRYLENVKGMKQAFARYEQQHSAVRTIEAHLEAATQG